MAPQMPNGLNPMENGAASHRNIISSLMGPFLDSSDDSTDTTLTDSSVLSQSPHFFQPPETSASRSPCPALNTLANHGYLPRDGRNITISNLVAALKHPETYQVSNNLAGLLAHGGLRLMHKSPPISLYDLAQHGLIEHDASLVHRNTADGHEYAPTECDPKLLEGLLGGQEYLTLDAVAKRREMVERVSPFKLDFIHQEIARGEWALVLDIFGRAHGGEVPADFLRVWLKENRFPDGWKPTHQQGLWETVKVSESIHEKMVEYGLKHVAMGGNDEETETEQDLALELQESTPESHLGVGREQVSHSPSPRPAKRRKTVEAVL